ncbi:hypothetical protein LG274_12105 [Micrococcus antarcticus]|uniref:hypothetical protein n=1 Tax=Micrococcus antarcticus TaxID=86171 RepID=UPI00384EAB7B
MEPVQPRTPPAYEEWKARLDDLTTQFETSEGYRYWYYIGEFRKTFNIWNDEHVELADLLLSYERDPKFLLGLNDVDRPNEEARLLRVLDRKALACMASYKAVEDHITSTLHVVSSAELEEEFAHRFTALKRDHALVAFMLRFRNYLQHHMTAPWGLSSNFTPGAFQGEMWLNATRLLAWDGFKGKAKRFLRDNEPTFHFRPVLVEFGERCSELALWYDEAVRREGATAMAEAEQLRLAAVRHHDSYEPGPPVQAGPAPSA